jgi:hypothetical protein
MLNLLLYHQHIEFILQIEYIVIVPVVSGPVVTIYGPRLFDPSKSEICGWNVVKDLYGLRR